MNPQPILVFTTLPDVANAEILAGQLIDSGCAACVSIGTPVRSLYHWNGKTETAEEVPLSIKTTAGRYDAVEALIRSLHSYELPEIIAVPITNGLAPYLDWIAAESERSASTANGGSIRV